MVAYNSNGATLGTVITVGFFLACTCFRAESEEFSAMSPDPSRLVWHEEPKAGKSAKGTLTVNIDPEDPESPTLQLEVAMRFSEQQPAPRNPLLMHCGGPGSDTQCQMYAGAYGYTLDKASYDVWSISQRGIGKNSPAFKCNSVKLPQKGKQHYDVSDFTDCPCAYADGTPHFNDRSVGIDPENEEEVRNLLEHAKLRSQRCYESDKFQIKDNRTGKVYNFLEWSGTQLLAHDINTMRLAIGAAKMSILGFSYGTMVGAVYASVFPQYTDQLVLNGNIPKFPDKSTFAIGAASGLRQAISKLLYNCRMNANCTFARPVEAFDEILEDIRSKQGLTAPTALGKPFRLTVGMLIGVLADLLGDSMGKKWKKAIELLTQLSRSSANANRTEGVKNVLDYVCHVNKTKTWSEFGTCVSTGHVAEDDKSDGSDSFIEMNAVLSQDSVGRYTVPDVIRQWQNVKAEYGPVGSTAYVAQMAAMFDWPAIPTPVAPMGNPKVPALVIGNLYDPATSYKWSQEMHMAFPAGRMMTWQGIGHCMSVFVNGLFKHVKTYDHSAMMDCHARVLKYLKTGELPRNGHVCRQTTKGAVPVLLQEGNI